MSRTISRNELIPLIDQHFEEYLNRPNYNIETVCPLELLTHNRLDIAIKVLHLKMQNEADINFAKDLYIKHIDAFTLGSFQEPGNPSKNGILNFLKIFDLLRDEFENNSFNERKGVIPCSSQGGISNGAHRVACAIYTNKKIPTVKIDVPSDSYDYRFFLKRGLSQVEIELAVTNYVDLVDNSYVALVWPSAIGNHNEITNIIPNIVYQNSLKMSYNSARNLLSQVYFEEDWLGSKLDNYPGINNKLIECFKSFDKLRIIVFQADSIEDVINIKENVRELFQIGKHSIHITDTKDEAIRLARILLNSNARHFLEHSNPNKYQSTQKNILKLKGLLAKNDINSEQILIDNEVLLSLYGISECKQIEYLSTVKLPERSFIKKGEPTLSYYDENKNTLIHDSRFHFYHEGLKFISFDQAFLKNRNMNNKNITNLMSECAEKTFSKNIFASIFQKYNYTISKLRPILTSILKRIRLYDFAKFIYKKISK